MWRGNELGESDRWNEDIRRDRAQSLLPWPWNHISVDSLTQGRGRESYFSHMTWHLFFLILPNSNEIIKPSEPYSVLHRHSFRQNRSVAFEGVSGSGLKEKGLCCVALGTEKGPAQCKPWCIKDSVTYIKLRNAQFFFNFSKGRSLIICNAFAGEGRYTFIICNSNSYSHKAADLEKQEIQHLSGSERYV